MNAHCDNCGRLWADNRLEPIHDLHERVAPGEIMPAGQCPECGALCHIESSTLQAIVNIECDRCGNLIETLDDETSTPSGSMHSQCAAEYEAEKPEDW